MKSALLIAGDYVRDEAVLVLSYVELEALNLVLVQADAATGADAAVRRVAASVNHLVAEMRAFRAGDGA